MKLKSDKPDATAYIMMLVVTANLVIHIMANYVELSTMIQGIPVTIHPADLFYLVFSFVMFGFSSAIFAMRMYGWVLPEKSIGEL